MQPRSLVLLVVFCISKPLSEAIVCFFSFFLSHAFHSSYSLSAPGIKDERLVSYGKGERMGISKTTLVITLDLVTEHELRVTCDWLEV